MTVRLSAESILGAASRSELQVEREHACIGGSQSQSSYRIYGICLLQLAQEARDSPRSIQGGMCGGSIGEYLGNIRFGGSAQLLKQSSDAAGVVEAGVGGCARGEGSDGVQRAGRPQLAQEPCYTIWVVQANRGGRIPRQEYPDGL